MVRLVLLALLAVPLTGCQLAGGYVATEFFLQAEPERVEMDRGGQQEVTVHVDRVLGIDVSPFPVALTLHEGPDGLSLAEGDTVTIPAGVDEEAVTLSASGSAELGEHEVVLRGSNGIRTKDATLTVTIGP
jgi:hypothetical protein